MEYEKELRAIIGNVFFDGAQSYQVDLSEKETKELIIKWQDKIIDFLQCTINSDEK